MMRSVMGVGTDCAAANLARYLARTFIIDLIHSPTDYCQMNDSMRFITSKQYDWGVKRDFEMVGLTKVLNQSYKADSHTEEFMPLTMGGFFYPHLHDIDEAGVPKFQNTINERLWNSWPKLDDKNTLLILSVYRVEDPVTVPSDRQEHTLILRSDPGLNRDNGYRIDGNTLYLAPEYYYCTDYDFLNKLLFFWKQSLKDD